MKKKKGQIGVAKLTFKGPGMDEIAAHAMKKVRQDYFNELDRVVREAQMALTLGLNKTFHTRPLTIQIRCPKKKK